MISNERRSPYISPSYGAPQYSQPKPRVVEDTINRAVIQIERKAFILTLKENPRGRFLRIEEVGSPRPAAIIIPAPGLKDFQKVLADMVKAENEIPPKKNTGGSQIVHPGGGK